MFFLSADPIDTHISILNPHLGRITQRHAGRADHARLVKIRRPVLIEVSRVEFLDDTRYCEVVKSDARGGDIADIVEVGIDVKGIVIVVSEFDERVEDTFDIGRIDTVINLVLGGTIISLGSGRRKKRLLHGACEVSASPKGLSHAGLRYWGK